MSAGFDLGNVVLRFTRVYRGYTLVLLEGEVGIEQGGERIDSAPNVSAAEKVVDFWLCAP